MSARVRLPAVPPLVALTSLLAVSLGSGCGGGGAGSAPDADAGRDTTSPVAHAPSPEAAIASAAAAPPAVTPSVASGSPFADPGADPPAASATPTLDVVASPGALTFRWDAPPAGTQLTRLHARDVAGGEERPLGLEIAPGTEGVRLAVSPHRLRWRTLAYRVEHCTAHGCTSSRHERVAGLAAATLRDVAPVVALRHERFGEALGLSADGAVLAVAAPVAGSVALYFTASGEAREGARLDVSDGAASTGRTLRVALSADGDTVAVLSADAASGRAPRIDLFERLGEGWIGTARFAAFPDAASASAPEATPASSTPGTLHLSADGDRLLVTGPGAAAARATLHERAADGWRSAAELLDAGDGALLASAADAALERVFVAVAGDDAAPVLRVHRAADGWRAGTGRALPSLDARAPLVLASDARGERIAAGGLEASAVAARPVLRRYRVTPAATPSGADAGAAPELELEDTLALAPPTPSDPALALAADATLGTVAFGWHTETDAVLHLRVTRDGRWRDALALPGDVSTLAKRGFGTALAFDADGTALAVGIPSGPYGPPRGTGPDAGRVLFLAPTPRGDGGG